MHKVGRRSVTRQFGIIAKCPRREMPREAGAIRGSRKRSSMALYSSWASPLWPALPERKDTRRSPERLAICHRSYWRSLGLNGIGSTSLGGGAPGCSLASGAVAGQCEDGGVQAAELVLCGGGAVSAVGQGMSAATWARTRASTRANGMSPGLVPASAAARAAAVATMLWMSSSAQASWRASSGSGRAVAGGSRGRPSSGGGTRFRFSTCRRRASRSRGLDRPDGRAWWSAPGSGRPSSSRCGSRP